MLLPLYGLATAPTAVCEHQHSRAQEFSKSRRRQAGMTSRWRPSAAFWALILGAMRVVLDGPEAAVVQWAGFVGAGIASRWAGTP